MVKPAAWGAGVLVEASGEGLWVMGVLVMGVLVYWLWIVGVLLVVDWVGGKGAWVASGVVADGGAMGSDGVVCGGVAAASVRCMVGRGAGTFFLADWAGAIGSNNKSTLVAR